MTAFMKLTQIWLKEITEEYYKCDNNDMYADVGCSQFGSCFPVNLP